jgi:hypothetical protein
VPEEVMTKHRWLVAALVVVVLAAGAFVRLATDKGRQVGRCRAESRTNSKLTGEPWYVAKTSLSWEFPVPRIECRYTSGVDNLAVDAPDVRLFVSVL